MLGLDEVGERLRAAVGGKAANLAVLLRAGVTVPRGFCVTTAAFELFLDSFPGRVRLAEMWGRCLAGGTYQVAGLSRMAREGLAAVEVPAAVKEAVLAAWRGVGEGGSYAVRSSATVEDAPERSFAGQFESVLNVRGEEALPVAIKECWLSMFSERALVYLAREPVPFERIKMAVLVQEMVAAEFSGVAFTADPHWGAGTASSPQQPSIRQSSGDEAVPTPIEREFHRLARGAMDRLVVEWVPGLGDALVQGTREPKRVVIEKSTGRVLEPENANEPAAEAGPDCTTDAQERRVGARGLQEGTGLVVGRVPSRGAGSGLQPELERLTVLAREVERLFGAPQDIEWACRDGEVWLLQARPITTLRPQPHAEPEVWTNLNAVENLPDVATPLTWSLLDHWLRRVFDPLLRLIGLDPASEPWLGLIAGRVYFGLNGWLKVLHCLPGFRQERLAWLFGGHQDALADTVQRQFASGSPSLRERIVRLSRVARLAAAFLWTARWESGRACLARFTRFVDSLAQLDCRQASADDLFARLNSVEPDVIRLRPVPVMLGSGIMFHGFFWRACRKWFADPNGAVANRLLSRAGGMASAESGVALWQLAASATAQPELRAAVQNARSFAELSHALAGSAAGREFLRQWDAFMRRYGHHAAGGELDIASVRWSEKPDDVLRLVQGFLAGAEQRNPARALDERARESRRLLEECCARLRNPLKRWWFRLALRQAQQWMVFRENLKSEVIRMVAVMRRMFLELGERMVRQGILERSGDIFFLACEEIEPVYRGTAGALDVRALIRTRREEFDRNRALAPPPVVVGRFDPARHTLPPVDGAARELKGLPVSAGVVTGPARVMLRADGGERVLPGEILVAPFTDPGWTPHFLAAAGLVTDIGGQLSHGSVIAREYGLPAVVNVPSATRTVHTGDLIEVDGDRGIVTVLNRRSAGKTHYERGT